MTTEFSERFLFPETTYRTEEPSMTTEPTPLEELEPMTIEVEEDDLESLLDEISSPGESAESDDPIMTSTLFEELSRERLRAEAPPSSPETPRRVPEERAAPVPLPAIENSFGYVDELLRNREQLLERIDRGQNLPEIARVMILTIVFCATAFGISVGLYRGGVQILFAAIKFPVVLLMTAAICAPAFTALKRGVQQPASLVRDFALVLTTLALGCLVTASLTPLLLLLVFHDTNYHDLILFIVFLCGVGGAAGYAMFHRGLQRELARGKRVILTSLLLVMGLVSTQMAWTMRPYVVRPQTEEVPFVRAIEGSFFQSVLGTFDSALAYSSHHDTYDARSWGTESVDPSMPTLKERVDARVRARRTEAGLPAQQGGAR